MKFELNQKKKLGVERIFRFKDKNTLLAIIKNSKNRKEYLMDLAALDPKIRSNTIIAFKPLISFCIFLLISFILFATPIIDLIPDAYQMLLLSVAITFAVVSFIFFILLSRRERIFVSRISKAPILYFYNGLPNKKEFKNFIQYIKDESQARFEKLKLDAEKQRAGEMRTIRRVFDEGVLSNSQYEKAKATLLKLADH